MIDINKRLNAADKVAHTSEEKKSSGKEGAKNKVPRFLMPTSEDSNPFGETDHGAIRYVVPTNIPTLDLRLPKDSNQTRRGFKAGGIHMVTADANNFKSTLMNRMCINVLNDNGALETGYAYFIDIDKHWDRDYFIGGACGKIKDTSVLTNNHFRYYKRNTFASIYTLISEIIWSWKENVNAYVEAHNKPIKNKKDHISAHNVYCPVDIAPVIIVVDGFSTLFSEQSLSNEFGKTKTAEDNSDAHRLMKLLMPSLEFLGISLFLTNHYRDIINMQQGGFKSMGPTRHPYLWKSMQGYINTAIDISVWSGKAKEYDSEKYKTNKQISFVLRKLKGVGAEERTPTLKYYLGKGFDLLGGNLAMLRDCGFASYVSNQDGSMAAKSDFEIKLTNAAGKKIPKALRPFVCKCTYAEFLNWIKEETNMKDFFNACKDSIAKLTPLSAAISAIDYGSIDQESILLDSEHEDADDVVIDGEEIDEAPSIVLDDEEDEKPKQISSTKDAEDYLNSLDEDEDNDGGVDDFDRDLFEEEEE